MTKPLFSIITITRNNLDGLKRTQASLESQSARNFEWIIIDGDSGDGTKDYLHDLPAVGISEPDDGIYDAMNKGIERAGGDYLLFLNAGDMLADMDILSTLSKAAAAGPDFIYGDALESNGLYKKARGGKELDWGMITHHQAMLYRREKIGALRYDAALKIAADYKFTRSFLSTARDMHYVPCAICIFEDGGISQRNRRLGRLEQFRVRAAEGHCSRIKNVAIYGIQSVSALTRQYLPALYFPLRKVYARIAR
jgi:putative colanic acid biosynthesis glycosyltransferase